MHTDTDILEVLIRSGDLGEYMHSDTFVKYEMNAKMINVTRLTEKKSS